MGVQARKTLGCLPALVPPGGHPKEANKVSGSAAVRGSPPPRSWAAIGPLVTVGMEGRWGAGHGLCRVWSDDWASVEQNGEKRRKEGGGREQDDG